jgi:two-component system chemotaxis sensor kinase CheA
MIDDQELCALFKAESDEHLQSLDAGLLRLEADPSDGATLEAVFRAAHSLKGAARMLGVSGVERIAHQLEEGLGAAHRGRAALSGDAVDRFYRALDAIRQLVHEAVTGEPAPVDLDRALAQLRGEPGETVRGAEVPPPPLPARSDPAANEPAVPSPPRIPDWGPRTVPAGTARVTDHPVAEPPEEPAATPAAATEPADQVDPLGTPVADPASRTANLLTEGRLTDPQPTPPAPQPAEFRIETIRVEPQKLDAVMTLAGELTVTATRVTRGLAELEEIGALWDEWNKDVMTAQDAGGSGDLRNVPNQHRFFERDQLRLERLRGLLDQFAETTRSEANRLTLVARELEEAVRTMRLLPLTTLFQLFPRTVRDLARSQAKEIELVIQGGDTTADKRILEELKDPLTHLVRNAVDHGIEVPEERERRGKPRRATVVLRAYQTAATVVVELADDGRGLDLDAIAQTAMRRGVCRPEELETMSPQQIQQFIFAPGFSTRSEVTDVSGRGVGLDVVRTNVDHLKGTIHVESSPGRGCLFRLEMPITLATTRVLLAQVGGRPYAIPVEAVQGAMLLAPEAIFRVEGRDTIRHEGQPVSVVPLADLLELAPPTDDAQRSERNAQRRTPDPVPALRLAPCALRLEGAKRPCILLSVNRHRVGLLIDGLLDEQEVVLKPLGPLLRRVRNVAGATILGTGEVCMVLNPDDLVKSVTGRRGDGATGRQGNTATEQDCSSRPVSSRSRLLLAEDSITTRTQMRRILEGAGYEVVTAVDGADAFGKLSAGEFDGVISDIEMPNMDGLQLTARNREDPRHKELPVILVTSLASEEDRRRGIEVGADAYLTKGTFDQSVLLETLRRLV